MTLAAGVSLHWDGLHGWLIFFACVSFALALLAAVKPVGRIKNVMAFIAAGLLLWAVTGIISG